MAGGASGRISYRVVTTCAGRERPCRVRTCGGESFDALVALVAVLFLRRGVPRETYMLRLQFLDVSHA